MMVSVLYERVRIIKINVFSMFILIMYAYSSINKKCEQDGATAILFYFVLGSITVHILYLV